MVIVVDVGATHTRVGGSRDGKDFFEKKRFATPREFQEGIRRIAEAISSLAGKEPVSSLVVGVPGVLEQRGEVTGMVTNLPSWRKQEIKSALAALLPTQITCCNDAQLAALGEASLGAGKGYRSVGYLTIGTGIGGALVVDGHLLPQASNSEPGHMVIDAQSAVTDGSGRRGTWEGLASGTAFARRFGSAPERCDDPLVWEQYAKLLGEGVINVILLWSPEVLVIGGGVALRGDLLFGPLVEFVATNLVVFRPPPIVPVKLGDDAGLYGGLALLQSVL